MYSKENTTGGMNSSDGQKQLFAKESVSFNLSNQVFCDIFKRHFTRLDIEQHRSQAQQTPVQFIDSEENSGKTFLISGALLILIIYIISKLT